jgi:hypothetical protein
MTLREKTYASRHRFQWFIALVLGSIMSASRRDRAAALGVVVRRPLSVIRASMSWNVFVRSLTGRRLYCMIAFILAGASPSPFPWAISGCCAGSRAHRR